MESDRLEKSHTFDEGVEIRRGLGVEYQRVERCFGKMGGMDGSCEDSKVIVYMENERKMHCRKCSC